MGCCRAQALRALLRDERNLQQERQAFQAKRKVYSGYAREDLDDANGDRSYDRADKESPGMGAIRRAVSILFMSLIQSLLSSLEAIFMECWQAPRSFLHILSDQPKGVLLARLQLPLL